MIYRTKPVKIIEIEAVQLSDKNAIAISEWLERNGMTVVAPYGGLHEPHGGGSWVLHISNSQSSMQLYPYDYLIKNSDGIFEVMSEFDFLEMYEPKFPKDIMLENMVDQWSSIAFRLADILIKLSSKFPVTEEEKQLFANLQKHLKDLKDEKALYI